MRRQLTSFVKYSISLLVAVGLMYYVFHDWQFDDLLARFGQVNFWWVGLSVALSLVSHWLRAWRWNLLLEYTGYHGLSTWRTFKAVMIGYLVNLAAPRLGEISRCGVLKRTDNVNMSASMGTVVAERLVDILGLGLLILLAFIIEFERISAFFNKFFYSRYEAWHITPGQFTLLVVFGLILAVMLVLIWWFRERLQRKPLYFKIRSFIREMYDGFVSVLHLQRKAGFWLATVGIWVLYYLMAFVMFYSVPATAHLGPSAGLAILIMGGLAMSAPVQGGFGTYHLFVGAILITYGIAEKDGYFFATLVHLSQTVTVVVVGAVSLLLTRLTDEKKDENNLNKK